MSIPIFSSFVAAGFECTAARGENRRRLDLLSATKHVEYCTADYQMLKKYDITTVREGFSWSTIDQLHKEYDFSRYLPILQAGKDEGIQQIWDLNHFDYPDHLDPFTDDFVHGFAEYATAVIHLLKQYNSKQVYIVPINEISFFAWIGADKGWWAPYKKTPSNGRLFKKQLVKAAIAAMDAIWKVDPTVRFIQVDPFLRRLAREPATRHAKKVVKDFNEVIRFEAWDMLSGRTYPELGGDPKYLDIIGMNYYIHNQEWIISQRVQRGLLYQLMDWESTDRISFAEMIKTVYERYKRPIYISESGSVGEMRPLWWSRLFKEIDEAKSMGLPIAGVCAYPVLDRPHSAGFLLPESGLWDFDQTDETCQRIPHRPTLEIIENYLKSNKIEMRS